MDDLNNGTEYRTCLLFRSRFNGSLKPSNFEHSVTVCVNVGIVIPQYSQLFCFAVKPRDPEPPSDTLRRLKVDL